MTLTSIRALLIAAILGLLIWAALILGLVRWIS